MASVKPSDTRRATSYSLTPGSASCQWRYNISIKLEAVVLTAQHYECHGLRVARRHQAGHVFLPNTRLSLLPMEIRYFNQARGCCPRCSALGAMASMYPAAKGGPTLPKAQPPANRDTAPSDKLVAVVLVTQCYACHGLYVVQRGEANLCKFWPNFAKALYEI